MWIRCLVERPQSFEILAKDRTSYTFKRFESAQITWVPVPEHQKTFLDSGHFEEWTGPTPDGPPVAGLSSKDADAANAAAAGAAQAAQQKASSTPDVSKLEGEELRAYAEKIGMGKVPASIKDETMRRRIAEHLEMKHQQDLDELQQGQQTSGESTEEKTDQP